MIGVVASALTVALSFVRIGPPTSSAQFVPSAGGGGGETTTASGGLAKVGSDLRLDPNCPDNGHWQWTGTAFTCIRDVRPRYGWRIFDDGFTAGTSNGLLALSVAGAGAGVLFGDTEVTRPGVLDLTCGTTATGRSALITAASTGGNSIIFGPGADAHMDASVKIEILSDGTNTHVDRVGFNDSTTGAGSDGVWFQSSATNWDCITASGGGGGTSDTEDSGVALVANTWYHLEIDIPAGTNVQPVFRIDGTTVCGSTTGRVPNGTARGTQPQMHITCSAGTVNTRTFTFDWLDFWGNFGDAAPSAHMLASSSRQQVFGSGASRPVTMQWADSFEFTPTTPRPLYILLHGRADTAANMQAVWGLNNLRNTGGPGGIGALVLAPSATSDGGTLAWNASDSCCWTGGSPPNDIGYIGDLIDEVLAASPSWNVDPKRIYLVGHSNGGFLAMQVACAREDVVAAVFDLAGAGPTATDPACTLSTPVAFAHAHGTNDTTIAPAGGTFPGMSVAYIALESASGTLDKLATANGCSGTMDVVTTSYADFTTSAAGSETDLLRQSGCAGHADVTYYKMNNAPHNPAFVTPAWPDEIVTYALAHPKP